MQGLFNLMAISSFAVSAGLVGGGAYLYLNKDKIITEVVDNAKTTITEEITKALPGIIDSVVEIPEMPEIPAIPSSTGPALPF
tara:strand:+ start:4285 stop:4533 length:249 start_codon:yes stop_codon:yes gene_type:complete